MLYVFCLPDTWRPDRTIGTHPAGWTPRDYLSVPSYTPTSSPGASVNREFIALYNDSFHTFVHSNNTLSLKKRGTKCFILFSQNTTGIRISKAIPRIHWLFSLTGMPHWIYGQRINCKAIDIEKGKAHSFQIPWRLLNNNVAEISDPEASITVERIEAEWSWFCSNK